MSVTVSAWAQKTPDAKVKIEKQDSGLVASVGEKFLVLNLEKGAAPLVLEGIQFAAATEGEGMRIFSVAVDFSIHCPQIAGWSARVPQNASAVFEFDFDNGNVTVTASAQNLKTILVNCDDGGVVELWAGGSSGIEFFKNGSYLVKGTGRIVAIDSDGQSVDFSIPGSIMTGGPLVLSKGPNGEERWHRVSPTIRLKVRGTPGKDLQILAGNKVVFDAQTGQNGVTFGELGSHISFSERAADGSLTWSAGKGDFRLNIEGIPNWIAVGVSGQSALMTWDKGSKTVDIKPLSGGPLRVLLPFNTFAVIPQNTVFQFAVNPGKIFAANAAGGAAKVYAADGREVANLDGGNILFDAKKFSSGSSDKGLLMRLAWDNSAPLEASGAAVFARLNPNEEQTVVYGQEGEARLTYSDGGFLTVEATRNKFVLSVQAVNGIKIHIEEGDSVSLTLDLKKGTFVIKTGEHNSNEVLVETASGFSPVLTADRALNFNVGKDGTLVARSGGTLLFFAPGSDLAARFISIAPPYARLDPKDTDKIKNPPKGGIKQPPVSVVR